jgi:tetratricopeptide (TPR) repeat protein/ADP-heptose:LPS heptosyltransferase
VEYRSRWLTGKLAKPHFDKPAWDGTDLAGRTVLLWAEQGTAETVQFVRYAPMVAARHARVILQCQRGLAKVLAGCPGIEQIIEAGSPLPPFECQASLMDLPEIMETTPNSIPRPVPYVVAQPDRGASWARKLKEWDGFFKVGIAWQNDGAKSDHRDVVLEQFGPLARIRKVRLFRLQSFKNVKSNSVNQRGFAALAPSLDLDKDGELLDAAAIIANLDLVITIDCAIAHLAGAMGVPVWTLLPRGADWRWMCDRTDSPWYPTIRLFRQPAPGDWPSVFREITEQLTLLSRETKLASPRAEALQARGLQWFRQGKAEEAVGFLEEAVQLKPEDAQYHNNLGVIRAHLKWVESAAESFKTANLLTPGTAGASGNLGLALLQLNRVEEAAQCFEEVIRHQPNLADAHNNLGVALARLDRHLDAERAYRRALEIQPHYAEAFHNLSNALRAQNRLEDAVEAMRCALKYRPAYAESLNGLGIALARQGKLEKAAECYHQVLEGRPDHPEAWNNLGVALADQGRLDEAISCYSKMLEIHPESEAGHRNRALAWLRQGNYELGWPEYEWRWKGRDRSMPPFNKPLWDGSSLHGKTLLVWSEQGLGDTLQFVRFVSSIKKRAGKVFLLAPGPLLRLLRSCTGIEEVQETTARLPAFDAHVPLMSLPGLCGTTFDSVPADVPYLFPDAERVRYWREKLSHVQGLKVGIVWQGNPKYAGDHHRSAQLEQLTPLCGIQGIRLISLQKDGGPAQLQAFPELGIVDVGSAEWEDFADTAAFVANLDHVIAVDTAVAHLAGALGKPVWLAVSYASDWRWLREHESTPWYPTMRLFRQEQRGDWCAVFERMARGLRGLVAEASPVSPRNELPPGSALTPDQQLTVLSSHSFQTGLPLFPAENITNAVVGFQMPATAESQEALFKHGVALAVAGKLGEAAATFEQVLVNEPSHVASRCNLGNLLLQLGRRESAVVHLHKAVELKPDGAELLHRIANLYRDYHLVDHAIAHYEKALALRSDVSELHLDMGLAFANCGRLENAAQCYRQAIRLKPELSEAYNNLGIICSEQEKNEEAASCYAKAIQLKPNAPEAYNNLGNLLRKEKKLDAAVANFEAALRLKTDYPQALNNLGITIADMGRVEEAVELYRKALAMKADYAEAHNNLGVSLADLSRPEEALQCYDRAIQLKPDYADARLNQALSWLQLGDFERGWPAYEWRWKRAGFCLPGFSQPIWNGAPAPGRTILLWTEQGMGDTIQFIRYAPKVRVLCGKVMLVTSPALMPLLARSPGIDEVYESGAALPYFDMYVPLMSLPGLFRANMATVPANVPYLSPTPDRVVYWHQRLARPRRKVGVVWRGNPKYPGDRYRSAALEHLVPLAKVEGVHFFSLQKEGGEVVADAPWMEDIGCATWPHFAETAAVVVNLDLVVTVDTAVAHLAGALGVPVWLGLPANSDWRWARFREDTPWYPKTRLFRQKIRGEWSEVFERMARELNALESTRGG